MLQSLINSLFGCSHQRTTFPLTPTRKNAGNPVPVARSGAYVTCLDCGQEFAYDWQQMRVISSERLRGCAQSHVEMEAKAS